jgi:hypothetical protein
MAKGKTPKKNKYDDLSDEFKAKVEAASNDGLIDILGEVSKNEELNRRCKEDDTGLASLKEKYDTAAGPYKESSKANRLKTRFVYDLLRARGQAE